MDEKPDDNPSKKEKISTEKTISIDKVPEPILADILSLLPIKTIVECYRVNRSFHSITTDDPRFYPLHFSRSPELLLCTPNLEKMVLVDLDSEGDKARELNLRLDNMEVMNSCRGLLCIRPLSSRGRIYVLNPFTLEFVVLPNLTIPLIPGFMRVAEWLGLGYSAKTNEYKVLSVVEYGFLSTVEQHFVIDIFTLGGTGSWRRLEGLAPSLKLTDCFSTFLNGSFHWVMNEYVVNDRFDFMTYFDLEEETFGGISLPNLFDLSEDPDRDGVRVLSLSAFEDALTLCVLNEDESISVWVMMEEYGDPESWYHTIYVSELLTNSIPENIRCFFPVKCINKNELGEPVIIYLLDNDLAILDHEDFEGSELDYYDTEIVKMNKFSHKMPPRSKAFMHIPVLMPFKKIIPGVTVVHSLRPTGRKVWRRCIDDNVDEWAISTIQEST